jgi:hypothetical protein
MPDLFAGLAIAVGVFECIAPGARELGIPCDERELHGVVMTRSAFRIRSGDADGAMSAYER